MTETVGPEGLEAWQNATKGRVVVRKYGVGGDIRQEMVGPNRVIQLSPQERRLNQELAWSEEADAFLNGTLQPVRLVEGDEDAEALASHPNHLSDTAAKKMFSQSLDKFAARLEEITNPAAMERLLGLAEDPTTGASFHQHKMVEERLTKLLAPEKIDHIKGHAPARDGRPDLEIIEGQSRAVTPR